jgi:hypothetical protein
MVDRAVSDYQSRLRDSENANAQSMPIMPILAGNNACIDLWNPRFASSGV